MFESFIFQPHLLLQVVFLLILAAVVGWLTLRWYSSGLDRPATLARILAVNLFVLGAGIGAAAWFGSFYPAMFAIVATGMLTFFDLLYHAVRNAPDKPLQDRDLRIAITGAITTMYLALVAFGVFVRIPTVGEQEAPLAQSLVVSFTSVVGIVIAFYFGTTAYLEGKAQDSNTQKEKRE